MVVPVGRELGRYSLWRISGRVDHARAAGAGAGLGLSSISPWPNSGASATTFTIMTAIGLIVVQWLAAAIGGFLTGRLRTKWVAVHVHEVFFRDTAHGFLTLGARNGRWPLAGRIGRLVDHWRRGACGASVAGGAAQGAGQIVSQAVSGVSAYDVDSLFRSDHPDPAGSPQDTNAQVTHILASGMTDGDVPAADRTYLAQLVAARTGISQADAEKRVDEVIAREKAAEVKGEASGRCGAQGSGAIRDLYGSLHVDWCVHRQRCCRVWWQHARRVFANRARFFTPVRRSDG